MFTATLAACVGPLDRNGVAERNQRIGRDLSAVGSCEELVERIDRAVDETADDGLIADRGWVAAATLRLEQLECQGIPR